MGMLTRYQKAGGFLQILKLIETCGKTKQENFLRIIEEEDSRWADAIKQRMLTVPRIFSWPEDQLSEVAGRLQTITIATAKHGLSEEEWNKFSTTFSHSQKRSIDDLAAKDPSDAEITAAYIKILEEVRNMISEGYLRPEKFDPELVIEDKIEENIGNSLGSTSNPMDMDSGESGTPNMEGFGSTGTAAPGSPSDPAEVKKMRQQLQKIAVENNNLKKENRMLKERIGQIKKLAA